LKAATPREIGCGRMLAESEKSARYFELPISLQKILLLFASSRLPNRFDCLLLSILLEKKIFDAEFAASLENFLQIPQILPKIIHQHILSLNVYI
jgi:hypothetical protein